MWRAPLSFVFCRENRSFLTKKLAEGCSFAEGRCSGGSLTGTDVGSARTPLFGTTDKRKRPWQNAKASSMCGLDFPVFEVVRSGEELAFREPALCSSNLAGDNPVQIEANQGLQRPLDFATSLTPSLASVSLSDFFSLHSLMAVLASSPDTESSSFLVRT